MCPPIDIKMNRGLSFEKLDRLDQVRFRDFLDVVARLLESLLHCRDDLSLVLDGSLRRKEFRQFETALHIGGSQVLRRPRWRLQSGVRKEQESAARHVHANFAK